MMSRVMMTWMSRCHGCLAAEPPVPESGHLLLDEAFLGRCRNRYSHKGGDAGAAKREFVPKFMNVIDPLLESNNLGRSVSKGEGTSQHPSLGGLQGGRKGVATAPCSGLVEWCGLLLIFPGGIHYVQVCSVRIAAVTYGMASE